MSKKLSSNVLPNKRLSIPRELIPHSLKGRIYDRTQNSIYQKSSNFTCPEESLCDSLDKNTTQTHVLSWMGFNLEDTTGSYFVATYGPETTYLGNNTYATKKWDKRLYWINIGDNVVPFPIQPRFVGIDEESGNEWYSVDYFGYQKAGVNYSNYWDNLSVSALILLISHP